ncbi:MAG: hypothetical protein GY940_34285 [bacterium]|nr:hypothetical protein [bacterium]
MKKHARQHLSVLYITLIFVIALLTTTGVQWAQTQTGGNDLFSDTIKRGSLDRSGDPTIVQTRFVNVNFNLLPSGDNTGGTNRNANALDLNLFGGVFYRAVPDRVETDSQGRTVWTGHIEGTKQGQVILVYKDQLMAGNISVPGAFYQVRFAGNGLHAIHKLDHSKFSACANPDEPPVSSYSSRQNPVLNPTADSGGSIDVMVVYNQAAETGSGGTAAIETEIALAITETNQGYANSNITQRVNLVHTALVTYTESGSIFTDRGRLQGTSDGYMDNVHTLRDAYGADLVVLITEGGGGYCGVAYIMTSVSTTFENYGFCVVKRSCATGYYSFGHELGHIMSARHDWYVDSSNNSPYTYNHANVNVAGQWRTVMGYNSECSANGVYCTRVNYWSNPNVTYGGDPMGVAEGSPNAADNHKTLDNTASTVENFRQHVPSPVPPASLTLTSPNGGETLNAGDRHTITWTSTGTVGNIKIDYTYNFSNFWTPIVTSTPNDGSYEWSVPTVSTSSAVVRIYPVGGGVTSDSSDAYFSIQIPAPPPDITVTSPNGGENWIVGSIHDITWNLGAGGGNVMIEYSTTNGTGWTTIASSTADDGIFSWTVPNTVSNSCLVKITDTTAGRASNTDTSDAVFSISTVPVVPPAIDISAPNGGESWPVDSSQVISWSSTGTVGNVKIEYSTNNGGGWTTITASTTNDGTHAWTVPNAVSSQCKVRISETDGSPSDTGSGVFSIVSASTPTITVTSPNGGEELEAGKSHSVTWTSTGTVGSVKIQYSVNNGNNWSNAINSTPNDGAYSWSVPTTESAQCLIRIKEASDGQPIDYSNAVFSIVSSTPPTAPTITVTSPNGGENLEAGTSHTITWTTTGTIGPVRIEFSQNNGGNWSTVVSSTSDGFSAPSGSGSYNWNVPSVDSSQCLIRVSEASDGNPSGSSGSVFTIYSPAPPAIALSRTQLDYGADTSGTVTRFQTVLVENSGGQTLGWSSSSDSSWLSVSPNSGTGSGVLTITANASGMTAGTYSGHIIVSDPTASNSPQTVSVTLTVYNSGSTSKPFGEFSTPANGSSVRSSIPVTGWVADDIEVLKVEIFNGTSYVGDATFVEGARPDVEQAYPGYPKNYNAGWGYMLLTNFLPGNGNGSYTLYANATDAEGHQVTLGSKTITCLNSSATKPFGAIDTPAQGGTASGGNFINWGWVLTPQPNRIPIDGSTIDVWVDGVKLGHPVYNIYRSDIATLFPGYENSNGAVGYFYLDTTAYTNGVHAIQWTAKDNAGNSDGIGSRYFTVQNTGSDTAQQHSATADTPTATVDKRAPVHIKKGFRRDVELQPVYPGGNGEIAVQINQLERLEIRFPGPTSNLVPMPIGSTLDPKGGIFYWQPGAGFLGNYRFSFLSTGKNGETVSVKLSIKIVPKF